MTLIQLQYIVALDDARHFSKAASHCHVSQPTLSLQIQKLEEELELQLFDRSKQPLVPTISGSTIIEQARQVIEGTQSIFQLASRTKHEVRGLFRLGAIPTITSSLLPIFATRFLEKHANVKLEVEELQSETIIERLRQNRLDAALIALPLEEKDLIEDALYYEPFVAYVPRAHRLADEKFIVQSELDLNDLLLLNKGHCFRNNVINLCSASEVEKKALNMQSGNFKTLIELCNRGFGMTLLPYLTALELSSEEQKLIKPFADPKPTREIGLLYKRTLPKASFISAIKEEILAIIPRKLHKPGYRNIISPQMTKHKKR